MIEQLSLITHPKRGNEKIAPKEVVEWLKRDSRNQNVRNSNLTNTLLIESVTQGEMRVTNERGLSRT